MKQEDWISRLFVSIDAKDTESFTSFLDEECYFRFGNFPAVVGAAAIRGFVGGFFASIAALKHELSEVWMVPAGAVCHGTVSYTRQDKSILTVPFANIFKTENGRIREYLIFTDTSQL